ncbi:basic proline-rich protein isoform X6 [Ixodes scapularis]|uniref:basic proline-rich protein isoform X6 n=1 Tax=Ixodes scapularis TaxID=6945 RepID=UPI001A9CD9D3|nr:basic proline-rich protein isoform X6 [Ixodes scapularis]
MHSGLIFSRACVTLRLLREVNFFSESVGAYTTVRLLETLFGTRAVPESESESSLRTRFRFPEMHHCPPESLSCSMSECSKLENSGEAFGVTAGLSSMGFTVGRCPGVTSEDEWSPMFATFSDEDIPSSTTPRSGGRQFVDRGPRGVPSPDVPGPAGTPGARAVQLDPRPAPGPAPRSAPGPRLDLQGARLPRLQPLPRHGLRRRGTAVDDGPGPRGNPTAFRSPRGARVQPGPSSPAAVRPPPLQARRRRAAGQCPPGSEPGARGPGAGATTRGSAPAQGRSPGPRGRSPPWPRSQERPGGRHARRRLRQPLLGGA